MSKPLHVGDTVSHYRITGKLGIGGMGVVYEAEDARLARKVALKFLPEEMADDPDAARRFQREADTIAQLNHPNICLIYDAVFDPEAGQFYLVMEYLEGQPLSNLIDRPASLPLNLSVDIVVGVLRALQYAHSRRVVHRDIKPANILLDNNGRPTLIDFGASRVALQGRTQALTAVYTPGYAAFEQSTSARQGPWTDIYALAATLYHCITGAPPPSASDRMIDDRVVPAADAGKGGTRPACWRRSMPA